MQVNLRCSLCGKTGLVVKNNHYYCPNCKIFIGQVFPQLKNNASINSLNILNVIEEKIIHDRTSIITTKIKSLSFILLLILLLFSFLNNLFYFDLSNQCFIRISPSFWEWSNSSIKKTLEVLKIASPKNYKNVCQRVSVINPNYSCGSFGGGCFSKLDSKTINISTFHNEVVSAAVAITYETCHVKQREENRSDDETECYKAGYKILDDLIGS